MKDYKKLFLVVFIFISNSIFSQSRDFSDSLSPNITSVSFNENEIILNEIVSYKYERLDNKFIIKSLEGSEILKGTIENIGYNKFFTKIIFVNLNKEFSNPKIIGRNDLIFALVNFNVFNNDSTINESKLKEFIEKYNTL